MTTRNLENILAENMRRFATKNLTEQDDLEYKVNQEQAKLKNIADKVTNKLRQLSSHQIDMISDETDNSGSVEYKIKTSIKWENARKGRNYKAGFVQPLLVLTIDATKDDTGNITNVESGNLHVTIYPNANPAAGLGQYYKTEHDIEIGAGMFGKPEDSIVDEILSLNDVANAFKI